MSRGRLPPAAAERLVKLCGLLGSDFEGERANAAAAAHRLLLEHRLTWADLLAPPSTAAEPPTWRAELRFCQAHPALLTAWEAKFLAALTVRERISEKQRAVLCRISARIRNAKAERAA